MKYLNIITAILLLLLGSPVMSQKYWTLQECIQYALENNIQLKRQELQVKTVQSDYRQSIRDYLPGLGITGNHYVGEGKVLIYDPYGFVDKKSERGSWEMTGSVKVFGGFGLHHSMLKSRFDYLAGLEQLEKTKHDIAIHIAGAFMQILYDEEMLELTKKQLQVTALEMESVSMQVEVGNYALGRLYEVKAQLANDQYQQTLAEEALSQSYLALAHMLQLENNAEFRVTRSLEEDMEPFQILPEQNEVYEYSSQHLPQLKMADFQLRSAEKNLALARSGFLPTIQMGYGISTWFQDGYGPLNGEPFAYFDQLKNNQTRFVGLNVSIPLFQKGANMNRYQKARLQKMDAALEYEQAKQDLYSEIQKVRSDAISALNRLESSRQSVTANEEAYSYAEQQYKIGLINFVELQIVSAALMNARSEFIQAKYNYSFRMILLDFYLGNPFW
jgi:outer membrane protein